MRSQLIVQGIQRRTDKHDLGCWGRREKLRGSCRVAAVVYLLTLIVLPAAVHAQTTSPAETDAAILERLDAQEAEIQRLQARLNELHPAVADPAPTLLIDAADGTDCCDSIQGASLKSAHEKDVANAAKKAADNKWSVKLGGHVQLDYIDWVDTDGIVGAEDHFNYRRLRLVADGTGYEQFDFRLQMTLEPGQGSNDSPLASPDVKDAYLSMNDIPGIGRIRIGNFFVPFSLEQVTNDTNNLFSERAIPTQGIFAADREVGIALYNCTEAKDITWAAGLFFDDLSDTYKARFGGKQGYRLSGRLTGLLYYDEPSDGRYLVHTGIGILHTRDYDDAVRFRARPQIQRGPVMIDSGNLTADSYTTGNLELAVVWGEIAVQNEAFLSGVDMISGDTVQVGGAYSHVSYFLTGENRKFERFGQHGAQFGRSKPDVNFSILPHQFGWGAWEAKARWSYLDLDNAAAGRYHDFTAGFNWYWSDRTRIMFDWIHPITSSETVVGSTESDLLAMRFDFNW